MNNIKMEVLPRGVQALINSFNPEIWYAGWCDDFGGEDDVIFKARWLDNHKDFAKIPLEKIRGAPGRYIFASWAHDNFNEVMIMHAPDLSMESVDAFIAMPETQHYIDNYKEICEKDNYEPIECMCLDRHDAYLSRVYEMKGDIGKGVLWCPCES